MLPNINVITLSFWWQPVYINHMILLQSKTIQMITLSFDDSLVTQLTMYCFHRKTNYNCTTTIIQNTEEIWQFTTNPSAVLYTGWFAVQSTNVVFAKMFLGSNPTVSYCQSFVIIYSRVYTQINAGQDKSTKAAVGKDRVLSHLDDIIMTSSPVNTSMHVDTQFPRIHTWYDK